MAKKELFHKLTDYKEQLELILEKKRFSVEAKNLLLNMVYKIEGSYNDYEMVRRKVDDKKTILEEIFSIIKECKDIEVLDPNSDMMKKLKKQNVSFKVDQKEKKISTFPDETAILEALYNLKESERVYMDEQYSAIRNSLPYVLEKGKNTAKTEIIRDFNGWSWNTDFNEVRNIECNLIYLNLEILLGKEFMNEWTKIDDRRNAIDVLRDELNECFKRDRDIKTFMNLLFKLSIIIYCEKDRKEKQRLEDELNNNNKELDMILDTEQLIEDMTKTKQKSSKEIEKIDKILNNKELLNKELEKVNKKNDEEIDKDELLINLKRKRRKLEKSIKDANKLLDPKYYSSYKAQLEENEKMLIAVEEIDKKEEYFIKFEKYFIKALKNKLTLINTKKDILDMLYIIRYYNFIPYSTEKFVKDKSELRNDINDLEDLIIDILVEDKMINKFSNVQKFDTKLAKMIFKFRTMNLDRINLEFKKGEKIRIIFYDEDTIEKGFEVKANNIKIAKYNKRIRMFP